jgi:hypothetical protein
MVWTMENLGFVYRQGQEEFFVFSTMSRRALGTIQWILRALSPVAKRSGRGGEDEGGHCSL